MFRNILLGILIVLAYTSCKNISPQSSCYKDTSHLDSPSIYKPDSTNNRWGGEEVLLFYQYQDEPGSNIHLTWDIYAHTIYFVSPNPIHFFTHSNKRTLINNHYSYYIAKTIYDYQMTQEGRTEDPLYFDVYFALIYPSDGRQTVFVGNGVAAPDVGDLLIDGKVYRDDRNLGDFLVEIISSQDSLFKEALSSAPFPYTMQHQDQNSINEKKEIKYVELYTYKNNEREFLHRPWIFPTAAESIYLTPERFYDIHKDFFEPIEIHSQEDIDSLLSDSIQGAKSYVYFILRVIYEDGSSSLRAISSKNKESLDIISRYIHDRPWEGPHSVQKVLKFVP